MIREAISKVVHGEKLSLPEASLVMEEIMSGQATDAQIASLITALRMRGETVEEITGFAKTMRQFAQKIYPRERKLIDTCGTGGDAACTFNISTATAFVVAGAGLAVAKHGNRSVSSHCGSADVLERLGVKIDIPPKEVARCIDEIGVGFLFAPTFHLAMKYAIGPRREIGIRTVFNILGPLTNPAEASHQILGCYDLNLLPILAQVLGNLGVKHALVVHGADGLDELSITGESDVCELIDGKVKSFKISPEELNLKKANLSEITTQNIDENAEILTLVLKGKEGAQRDIVLLNSAAAFLAAEKARTWNEGIEIAANSIDSGQAYQKLKDLIEFTNKVGK